MDPVAGSFYKYRPIHNDGDISRQHLRELIVDHTMFFSKPSKLNDPYDCRPTATYSDKKKLLSSIRKSNKRVETREGIKRSREESNAVATASATEMAKPTVRNEALYRTFDRHTGVFCTSEKPNINTQWAYYGNSHRGLCLEFTLEQAEKPIFAVPVQYIPERPSVDVVRLVDDKKYQADILMVAITSKSEEWRHEKEVRFLRRESGHYEYDPQILTSVIFGLDTPGGYIDFVRELIDEAKISPTLSRCVPDTGTFDIHIEPMKK